MINGVTTLDLLYIQKHLLGIELLSSPYALIAADVNRSGDVSTLDVALIQLAILGRVQEDIDLGWRFVAKDYIFPNPSNPWVVEFPEYIKYDGLNKNEMESDFVAIKLGDVNNSAVADGSSIVGLRNDSKVIMTTEDRLVEKGEQIEIEFKVQREITLEAMQWTLDYDESYLELIDMNQDIFETATDYNQGEVYHSWIFARGAQFDAEMNIATYTFVAKEKGMLSNLIRIDDENPSEVYISGAGAGIMQLEFVEGKSQEYVLYQNRPNPFTDQTQIQFYIPHETKATIKIFDTAGKVLKEEQNTYSKGLQSIDIRMEDLSSGGILYYRLETADYVATKKMIVLK